MAKTKTPGQVMMEEVREHVHRAILTFRPMIENPMMITPARASATDLHHKLMVILDNIDGAHWGWD